MENGCELTNELIAMVKRNILDGMSMDNAFKAAVALPRFSDHDTRHIQGLVEHRLFDRILLNEESAMEPCPFFNSLSAGRDTQLTRPETGHKKGEGTMKNMTAEIPAEIRDLYRTVKQNPDSGIAFYCDKYTDKEIIQMLLSLESGIELNEIQSGSADPGRLADAVKSLRRENLYIKDGQQTTYEVAKSLYILKKKYNVETACFCCDTLKDGFISILTLAVTIGVNIAFPRSEAYVL